MNALLNETHDAALQSWVTSANDGISDFPIQNLPIAIFRRVDSTENFRAGVAIGDQILDIPAAQICGIFSDLALAAAIAASGDSLNALMALSPAHWSAFRLALSRALRAGSGHEAKLAACLVPQSEIQFALPARIGDYTDFYTSLHHATNVGKLFRPDNPLLPNYKWVPIGYHGRASSIRVSGQIFPRPIGQKMPPNATVPNFGPSKRMDYELELGLFIGGGNALGASIPIAEAEQHLFGVCLLNDWSARDIQGWEYQPLGPFLSKSFATTISPWIVMTEALAPFRAAFTRDGEDPAPLPYLDSPTNQAHGAFNIKITAAIETATMRAANLSAAPLSTTTYARAAYWTPAQLIAHHTVNGCNLQPGDLLGTGTLSGPSLAESGALIEITGGGKNPITLPNGETRTFLEDGDAVTITASCEKNGFARLGFGRCWGRVVAAKTLA